MVGYENKVADLIKEEAKKKNMEYLMEDIVIPTRDHTEIRRGKKYIVKKKIFPGYVLLKIKPGENIWGMIKNVNYVAKFLGGKNKPRALSEKEIEDIFSNMENIEVRENSKDIFLPGEMVKIMDGPFEGFSALIDTVDDEKRLIWVSVSIFSRETPLELKFEQVKKITE